MTLFVSQSLVTRKRPCWAAYVCASLLLSWTATRAQTTTRPPPPPPQYDARPIRDGAVIARIGDDTNAPCVVQLPGWLRRSERADPTAEYYLYYSSHQAMHIAMSWAVNPYGPWIPFNLEAGPFLVNGTERTARGVMDFDADVQRFDWGHVSAPDVHVGNRTFTMYFHGRNSPKVMVNGNVLAKTHHNTFVATSRTGLNFNGPAAGGEDGHGPRTVTYKGITRDLCVTELYARIFYRPPKNEAANISIPLGPYAMSKRGVITRPRDFANPFAPQPPTTAKRTFIRRNGTRTKLTVKLNPFSCAWSHVHSRPIAAWKESDAREIQPLYVSAVATFMASSEFAKHPNNPMPGYRVASSKYAVNNTLHVNHVAVFPLFDGTQRVEVFFWIKSVFRDLYRVILDVSDDVWTNWDLARDPNTGVVYFDVILTPEEASRKVRQGLRETANENGVEPVFNEETHAVSIEDLGDPFILQKSGRKFLFLSYSSETATEEDFHWGQGQITSFQLFKKRPWMS